VGDAFQAATYVTAPQINVASGVALAIKLLRHVPAKPGDAVRGAARELRAATQRVQDDWAKQKPRAKTDPRPFDNAADVSWSALADRLAALSVLPAERHPLARRAGALLDALELRDRSWLKLRYNEQWAQAQRRLDRVRADGLRGDLDAAAGDGFLTEVETAHAAYGAALGITVKHDAAEANVAVAESLRALAAAIAEYGLQLGAQYRRADDETRTAIRAALRPIDEHRARYARSATGGAGGEGGAGGTGGEGGEGGADGEDVSPVTPLPDPA